MGAPPPRAPSWAHVEPNGRLVLSAARGPHQAALERFQLALLRARSLSSDGAAAEFTAWRELLDFTAAPPTPPRRLELLRFLTVCETELAQAKQRHGGLPGPLAARLAERIVAWDAVLSRASRHPPPRPKLSTLQSPVEPAIVTSFFGPRTDPFDRRPRYHLGLDLKAERGQAVFSAAAGEVVSAGWSGGHGLRVELAHERGLVTGYSHLSRLFVQPGARVEAGTLLGFAGMTGRATGPHVHFEVWQDGEAADPLDLLAESAYVEIRADAPLP